MAIEILVPSIIKVGGGALAEASSILKYLGVKRPLIVTDRGIAPLPLLEKFRAGMKGLEVSVYSQIGSNPTRSQVEDGVAAFRAHRSDSIVGLGGGAALDVAKAIALMAVHPGDVLELRFVQIGDGQS